DAGGRLRGRGLGLRGERRGPARRPSALRAPRGELPRGLEEDPAGEDGIDRVGLPPGDHHPLRGRQARGLLDDAHRVQPAVARAPPEGSRGPPQTAIKRKSPGGSGPRWSPPRSPPGPPGSLAPGRARGFFSPRPGRPPPPPPPGTNPAAWASPTTAASSRRCR